MIVAAWIVALLITAALAFVLWCLLKVGKYHEAELWGLHDREEAERAHQETADHT